MGIMWVYECVRLFLELFIMAFARWVGVEICSLPMNGQVEWRAWTAIYYYFSFGGVRARWVGCVGDLGEAQGEIRGSVWTTGVRALVS